MLIPTKERARGQWRHILPQLGIDAKYLAGRNCPCPICGGTDRFRFIDRKGCDGDGMWVCSQCTPHARPAIDLVIAFTGWPFKQAAHEIDAILGGEIVRSPPAPRRIEDNTDFSAFARKIWARGVRVQRGDVVDRYLRARGVGMDICPPCIRTSPLDWYRDDETGELSRHPAMLALIRGADGKPIATHRTYLAADGQARRRSHGRARSPAGTAGTQQSD
jgi:putative DNA primase/helicase